MSSLSAFVAMAVLGLGVGPMGDLLPPPSPRRHLPALRESSRRYRPKNKNKAAQKRQKLARRRNR